MHINLNDYQALKENPLLVTLRHQTKRRPPPLCVHTTSMHINLNDYQALKENPLLVTLRHHPKTSI